MATLPRYNRKATVVSSNWGDYTWFVCPRDVGVAEAAGTPPAAGEPCKLAYGLDGSSDMMARVQTGPADGNDPLNYVEGLLAYAAFGILCALLSLLCAFCFCIARSCCCCVRGGGCGKRYPTYALSAFRLGFTEVDAPLLASAKSTAAPGAGHRTELAYPLRSRWLARILMLVYATIVVAFVVVGQQRGNQGVTQSLKVIADSPSSFMSTVRSLTTPMSNLVVAVAADTLSPFLVDLNATVNNAADVREIAANVHCVTHGVRTQLPDPGALLDFVDVVQGTMDAVDGNATALSYGIGNVTATLTATSPMTAMLATNLTSLKGCIDALRASVAAAGQTSPPSPRW
jgi:hypothetical protein